MFRRKIYESLLDWKKHYNGKYACLIEGARRVGKTSIVEEFAKNEYKSYILIDFSKASKEILESFDSIGDLNYFFLKLQTEAGINLYTRESVIIFDEVQLFPKARQAIKHLVADGRYDYIETGSLISIRKNTKDILIPSEEHRISMYPMDYEEFTWALGSSLDPLRSFFDSGLQLGETVNRNQMRRYRLYLAVGGMPQAVEAYVEHRSFDEIDDIKREIIALYHEDLYKLDPTGRLSMAYDAIPGQLAGKRKRFILSAATGKEKEEKDIERINDFADSKMVLPCYNVTKPAVSLSQTKDIETYKLYLSDVGLFTTMLFNDSDDSHEDIYKKLLSDKLDADLGYLYENAVAQEIMSKGRKLYYHTWQKEGSTHSYEVDFLIAKNRKIIPIEVKSSKVRPHKSMDEFCRKYSKDVGERYILSKKDVSKDGMLQLKPLYMVQYVVE